MAKTARYRVVTSVCLGGGEDVYAGEEVELDEARAKPLEQTGSLERIVEPEAADEMDFGDPEAEHGDPEAETLDPTPRRGRRR